MGSEWHQIIRNDPKPAPWRLTGLYMVTQLKLIEDINKGYIHFWTRPDRPWRNKIYEANCIEAEIKNLYKKQAPKNISRQEEDISESSKRMRDMWMQSEFASRPTS
jgi:hypothetical protein